MDPPTPVIRLPPQVCPNPPAILSFPFWAAPQSPPLQTVVVTVNIYRRKSLPGNKYCMNEKQMYGGNG